MVLTRSPTWNLSVPGTHRVDDSDGFVSEPGGKFGVFKVLSFPEHDLGTIEADGLHFQADLTLTWFCKRQVLDLEHIRGSCFMKADNLWHNRSPL